MLSAAADIGGAAGTVASGGGTAGGGEDGVTPSGGGAVGAVSVCAMAANVAMPSANASRTPARSARLAQLREAVQAFPMPAAVKAVARRRGVPVQEDVRPPLRRLAEDEREALFAAVDRVVG